MKFKPIYIAIGAAVVIIGGAYWCFSSGPCANNGSAPDGTPTNPLGKVGAAISSVLTSNNQDLADASADNDAGVGFVATVQGTVNNALDIVGNWWNGISGNTGD